MTPNCVVIHGLRSPVLDDWILPTNLKGFSFQLALYTAFTEGQINIVQRLYLKVFSCSLPLAVNY